MILVGTHLDKVTQSEADDLLELAWKKYRKPSIYPNLVATAAVSNVQKGLLSRNGIDGLRSTIYEVACHLFVGKQDTCKCTHWGGGRTRPCQCCSHGNRLVVSVL